MALETAWCNALVEFLQANRADRLPFRGRLGGAKAVPGAVTLVFVAIKERQITDGALPEAVTNREEAAQVLPQSVSKAIVSGICPICRILTKSLVLAVSWPGSRLDAPRSPIWASIDCGAS